MSSLRDAIPFVFISVVMALGLRIDVMDIDAAQYASISAEILDTGNWLSPTNRHGPYLDKPPLQFWLSAASMAVIGVGNAGYKLPALLLAMLALFSTYRLALLLQGPGPARTAALVLGSMLALMLMTNDVRTDTALLSCSVTSVWLWAEVVKGGRWIHLVGASMFTALAMLAKGPIGAIIPIITVGPYVLLHLRDVRSQWYTLPIAASIVALMLTPMCIGLWRDHGADGIRFYFWTQSFGRITGENRWHDDSTFFYLSHVLLWATAPWTFIGIAALWRGIRSIPEWVRQRTMMLLPISAALLGYTAVSLSHYKLPHYVFFILPYVAILIAIELEGHKSWHTLAIGVACIIMLVAAWGLGLWAFPVRWPFILGLSMGISAAALWVHRSHIPCTLTETGTLLACAAYLCLNGHLYPELMRYQANSQIGHWADENGILPGKLISFATGGHSLDFYAGGTVPWYGSLPDVLPAIGQGTYVVADSARGAELYAIGLIPKQKVEFHSYRVQMLTWVFIDPKTREKAVKPSYVLIY